MDYFPWKKWVDHIQSFQKNNGEMAKFAQNSQKLSKIAVFRFLVNEYSIEFNGTTSSQNNIIGKEGN